MNIFKKILKSRAGSFLLMGVIIIPTLLTIGTVGVASFMRSDNLKAKYQTMLDNEAYVIAEKYGMTYTYNGERFGYFETRDSSVTTAIENHVSQFVSCLDGFNSEWNFSIEYITNDNHRINTSVSTYTTFVKLTLYIVLPNCESNNYSRYYIEHSGEWNARLNSYRQDENTNQMKTLTFTSHSTKI